ncbi:MAG: hypothetical protein ABUL58_04410 [Steroidobacter sp.]
MIGVLTVLVAGDAQYSFAGNAGSDIFWIWHGSDAPIKAAELAVLFDSIQYSDGQLVVVPRRKQLLVSSTTLITPVVHVQIKQSIASASCKKIFETVEDSLLRAGQQSTSHWVQLDFEPMADQLEFYASLLKFLRERLDKKLKLSATIQAGWCTRSEVVSQFAADELVPMFFRMGKSGSGYVNRLQHDPLSFSVRCRSEGIGIAVQEPLPGNIIRRYARRYWFNYSNWQE